ncbi:histone deacetylase [Calidithermus timidus]|jgi:acetoin utilization deacetylase AcuC-like enzyme|uniref:histone deacetylase family protein n=1 Tax=Calidithermus timidus TaxID=307124 RepID=UPI0003644199|nr:histone deacetylase [Calidithermus timidus]
MKARAYSAALSLPPVAGFAQLWEVIREELEEVLELRPSPAARLEELALAHDQGYLHHVFGEGLSRAESLRLGRHFSPELLQRALYSAGGTLAALEDALQGGLGLNLGGGTHHAYPAHAEGYSLFNDVAVAIAKARAEGFGGRVLVVDLDVHQGNGTAVFFQSDPSVFTLSLHAQHNYPQLKERSDLDVALPDATGDAEYLAALEPALERAFAFRPDLVFFNSGVDVLAGDRLGRLALSLDGLIERNRRVYQKVRESGAALVVVGGGGYHPDLRLLAEARIQTYRLAVAELWSVTRGG